MACGAHGDASGKVEKAIAVHIGDNTAPGVVGDQWIGTG
jgi:hypothetical protein